mmetsp:Transcript_35704/g.34740  ORF Transcript_35704/g.34740 Transcript_35704/m.34740 type:complete len:95 (-) Transcript_35704:479-763(-)
MLLLEFPFFAFYVILVVSAIMIIIWVFNSEIFVRNSRLALFINFHQFLAFLIYGLHLVDIIILQHVLLVKASSIHRICLKVALKELIFIVSIRG